MLVLESKASELRASQLKAIDIALENSELIREYEKLSNDLYSRFPFALNTYKTGYKFSSEEEKKEYSTLVKSRDKKRSEIIGDSKISYSSIKKWYDLMKGNPDKFQKRYIELKRLADKDNKLKDLSVEQDPNYQLTPEEEAEFDRYDAMGQFTADDILKKIKSGKRESVESNLDSFDKEYVVDFDLVDDTLKVSYNLPSRKFKNQKTIKNYIYDQAKSLGMRVRSINDINANDSSTEIDVQYQEDNSDSVLHEKNYTGIAYHASPLDNLDSILSKGLLINRKDEVAKGKIPSKGTMFGFNFNESGRLYLTLKNSWAITGGWITIKFQVPGLNLYRDSQAKMGDAYYVTSDIPPDNILEIVKREVKDGEYVDTIIYPRDKVESFMEADRNELIGKARSQDQKRYHDRMKYRPAAFEGVNIRELFTHDDLVFTTKVGEYTCILAVNGVLTALKSHLRGKVKCTYADVLKVINQCLDKDGLRIDCECPDFTYRFKHWAYKGGYLYGDPGKAVEAPKYDKTNQAGRGSMCKHLASLITNKTWIVKVAAGVNNYIRMNVEQCYPYLDLEIPKTSKKDKVPEVPTNTDLDKVDKVSTGEEPEDTSTDSDELVRGEDEVEPKGGSGSN